MRKTKKIALKLPLLVCFMSMNSASSNELGSALETISRVSALGNVCNYKQLPDYQKNQILKTAYSMMPQGDQSQIAKGVSNYIVFLQGTQKQLEDRCSDETKNQQLCANLSRRSKTFYKVDVERGVKKVESYVSRFRPQIKKAIAHCSNPDEIVDSALEDLKGKADVLEDLHQSNFQGALETMRGLANDFAIEIKDERVPNPIMKKFPHMASHVYDDSMMSGDVCPDEAEKSLSPSSLTSQLLKMADKMADLFNPDKPKSVSAVDK